MIYFIAALYNEEAEVTDLLWHVYNLVDGYSLADDGSTDNTYKMIWQLVVDKDFIKPIQYTQLDHTGLPETVKNEALQAVPDASWVLMLDADERLSEPAYQGIREFLATDDGTVDYVYFNQLEIIDNKPVREFQKAKLFKKEVIQFPLNNIHADDQFTGNGIYKPEWRVFHRKSTSKQIQREIEYLQTYEKLYKEGHIDEGRLKWLQGLHHYVRPHG